jgi:hypothetical protein
LKSQDGLELCSGLLHDQTPLACKKGTVLAITDPLENLNENKVAK